MSYISAVYLYFGAQHTPIDHLQMFEHKATPSDLVEELKIDLKRTGIEISSAIYAKVSSNYLDEASLLSAFTSAISTQSSPVSINVDNAKTPPQKFSSGDNSYDSNDADDDTPQCSQTPSDYYFSVGVNSDTQSGFEFTVVSKTFWNTHGHVDGFGYYPSILDTVGLMAIMDNVFDVNTDITSADDVKQKLKVFGMTQNQEIAGGVPDPLATAGVPDIDAITPGSQDPNDYFFAVGIHDGKQYLVLTPKESWNIFHCIDDSGFIPDFTAGVGLVYNDADGIYYSCGDKSVNKCAIELRNIGCTQNQELI